MWMKSWSSSTSRPQPSAIPDLRRPNIRIGRGSRRRLAWPAASSRPPGSPDPPQAPGGPRGIHAEDRPLRVHGIVDARQAGQRGSGPSTRYGVPNGTLAWLPARFPRGMGGSPSGGVVQAHHRRPQRGPCCVGQVRATVWACVPASSAAQKRTRSPPNMYGGTGYLSCFIPFADRDSTK